MTHAELGVLRQGKSVLKTDINGVPTKVLFKFLIYRHTKECYSICATQDFNNPEPDKILETDLELSKSKAEIIQL
jgi:hypothetical protein